MKLLLLDDVDKLGFFGDVVTVKDGYARNYLLPQCIAEIPTQAKIDEIAEERAKRVEVRKIENNRLKNTAEKVEGAVITITALANEQGHLFGSVGEKEIAKFLTEAGYEVQAKHVVLSHHFREVGSFEVHLRFADGVSANIHLNVVAPVEENIDDTAEETVSEATDE